MSRFINVRWASFNNFDEYIKAIALGASTLEELELIQKYEAPDFESVLFLEQGGFLCFKTYEQAKKEGYVTFEDYLNK